MRYLIIGASAAGLSAALKIRELDVDGEIIVLSEEKSPPYSKMSLPYLLSGECSKEEDLYLGIPEGVKLLLDKKVVSLKEGRKVVETETGEEFPYDKLLIATGAHPYIPEVEKKGSPLITSIRNLEDISGLKERIKNSKEKRVILSGAGLVNCEIADALLKIGVPSVFVIRSNRILSQILDEEGSRAIESCAKEKGIELLTGENIKTVEEKDGITYAILESGKVLKGSCVIFGKGVRPSVDFLEDTRIKIGRGIRIDRYLHASVKDVYAAGDVTESKDLVYEDVRGHALWPVAVEQGKVAGANMAGGEIEYPEEVSRNILSIFGQTIFTGGISTEDKFEVYKEHLAGEYRKILIHNNKLVGFVFVGEADSPGVYLFAMKNKIDVSENINLLLKGALSYPIIYPSIRKVVL
ncbi:MAG: FAD-dependent oxidoreductase [Candidatus Caldatribacteriota bacterium]|nr:FAD-dependent oxidoreductase [Candidatus Caldatribacteriota bacterium]